jgi:adenosylcobyric acid synthase
MEGQAGKYQGLNLLPVKTVITGQKIARQRQVTSNYPQAGLPVSGFEIHQGRTVSNIASLSRVENPGEQKSCQPLFDDANLGLVDSCQSIWGTYLHGIFDNGPWRRAWVNRLRQQRGLKSLPTGVANYREQREQILDALATQIEEHLDLTPFI